MAQCTSDENSFVATIKKIPGWVLEALGYKDECIAARDAAATSQTNAAVSAASAATSATASEAAKDDAVIERNAAATSAASAATSATSAASNASQSISAKDLSVSASNAAGISEANAATSATSAATSATSAATSATSAATSETNAEKWAEENEDIEVVFGKYSAKHWAAKSLASSGAQTGSDTVNVWIKYPSNNIGVISGYANETTIVGVYQDGWYKHSLTVNVPFDMSSRDVNAQCYHITDPFLFVNASQAFPGTLDIVFISKRTTPITADFSWKISGIYT